MAINKSTESLIKGYGEFNLAKVECSSSQAKGEVNWEGYDGREGGRAVQKHLSSPAL